MSCSDIKYSGLYRLTGTMEKDGAVRSNIYKRRDLNDRYEEVRQLAESELLLRLLLERSSIPVTEERYMEAIKASIKRKDLNELFKGTVSFIHIVLGGGRMIWYTANGASIKDAAEAANAPESVGNLDLGMWVVWQKYSSGDAYYGSELSIDYVIACKDMSFFDWWKLIKTQEERYLSLLMERQNKKEVS